MKKLNQEIEILENTVGLLKVRQELFDSVRYPFHSKQEKRRSRKLWREVLILKRELEGLKEMKAVLEAETEESFVWCGHVVDAPF